MNEDELAPDADEPGDSPPEDLLPLVTPPDEVVPDEVDKPDPPDQVIS